MTQAKVAAGLGGEEDASGIAPPHGADLVHGCARVGGRPLRGGAGRACDTPVRALVPVEGLDAPDAARGRAVP